MRLCVALATADRPAAAAILRSGPARTATGVLSPQYSMRPNYSEACIACQIPEGLAAGVGRPPARADPGPAPRGGGPGGGRAGRWPKMEGLRGRVTVPISQELLQILCCPRTKTPVVMLAPGQLARLNAAVEADGLEYADGAAVEEPLEEGLVTTDGTNRLPHRRRDPGDAGRTGDPYRPARGLVGQAHEKGAAPACAGPPRG